MRGDPPQAGPKGGYIVKSTPHARGSTVDPSVWEVEHNVYPACAGIHHRPIQDPVRRSSLPRMRGDPPRQPRQRYLRRMSTPHARGSTPKKKGVITNVRVYPACAGIHLIWNMIHESPTGLPRMRGDPPMAIVSVKLSILSTPHARGSTFRGKRDDL